MNAAVLSRPVLLGPVDKSFVAHAREIDTWFQAAEVGDTCIYARVAVLPLGSTGGMRARGLYDRGAVSLTRARCTDDHSLFEFRMKKLPPPRQQLSAPVLPPRANPDEARLLGHIEELAERGKAIGMNAGVATRLDLRCGDVVDQLLTRLIRRGLIERRVMTKPPYRVIRIVATGAETGLKW